MNQPFESNHPRATDAAPAATPGADVMNSITATTTPPIGPVPEPAKPPPEVPVPEPRSPVHPRPEPPQPATPQPDTVPEPVSPVEPRPVPPDPDLPLPTPEPVKRHATSTPMALSVRLAYHLAHGRIRDVIRHRLGARRLPI